MNQLLEREIEKIETERPDSVVHKLNLADLVMMQMTGDFDAFITQLPTANSVDKKKDFNKIDGIIEETRKEITTEKLFKSIVQKTITSQFGDKHAALRELGQNCVDSYGPEDTKRKVMFNVAGEGDYLVLRVRDFGGGMGLQDIVKDLLIPYNSGKEFDVTKIGEHGIGWYSVVDLAEVVKVTSRKKGFDNSSQVLVYKEDDEWKTAINPVSNNGFFKETDLAKEGTEVTAFIKQGVTSEEDIKNFMYQYLGMVSESDAQILFNGEKINSVREEYVVGQPIPVSKKNLERPLLMGVSKREIRGEYKDFRFKHRNNNLDKLLLTQRGLFIKYEPLSFHSDSVHSRLANDLIKMGLDLWVDVPDNVTLTKGRNNVVADDWPNVLEGTYKGFENLFLEVILNDKELLDHPQQELAHSIAKLFDTEYEGFVLKKERDRYSLGRRALTNTLAVLVGGINGGKYIVSGTGKVIGAIASYPFIKMPKHIMGIGGLIKEVGETIKENKEEIKDSLKHFGKVTSIGTGILAGAVVGLGGLGFGIYNLWEKYGWDFPLSVGIATGITAGGVGAYYAGRSIKENWPEIEEGLRSVPRGIKQGLDYVVEKLIEKSKLELNFTSPFKNSFGSSFAGAFGKGLMISCGAARCGLEFLTKSPVFIAKSFYHVGQSIGQGIVNIPGAIFDGGTYAANGIRLGGRKLLNSLNLYTDIEGKREKKRQKLLKKVSNRYKSYFRKDAFLNAIMAKEIIPAEFYYCEHAEKQQPPRRTIGRMFADGFNELSDSWNLNYSDQMGRVLTGGTSIPEKIEPYTILNQSKNLLVRNNKISIEQLINLFVENKLRYQKYSNLGYVKKSMSNGEYFVDYNNSIVQSVVDKLEGTRGEISHRYNVKVLEDRLDSLAEFGLDTACALYYCSGLGIVHAILNCAFKNKVKKNPFETSSVYQSGSNAISSIMRSGSKAISSIRKSGRNALGGSLNLLKKINYSGREFGRKHAKDLAVGTLMLPYNTLYLGARMTAGLGRFSYNRVIKPVAVSIEPNKFPGYYRRARKFVKNEIESHKKAAEKAAADRKARREFYKESSRKQKEALKNERLEEEKEFKRQHPEKVGIFTRLKKNIHKWYTESSLMDYFGDGIRSGDSFSNLRKDRLKTISRLSGVGSGYIDFIDAISGVDALISEAIGRKSFNAGIHYHPAGILGLKTQVEDYGLQCDKKSRLNIETATENNAVSLFASREKARVMVRAGDSFSKTNICEFDYKILDMLIHQRAHESRKTYPGESMFRDPDHRNDFYLEKEKLRKKVVSYILSKNINLTSYINNFLPNDDRALDRFYVIPGKDLCSLEHMTRRRLLLAREDYDILRTKPVEENKIDPLGPIGPIVGKEKY